MALKTKTEQYIDRIGVFSLILLILGLFSGIYSTIEGHSALFGTSRQVVWGVLISTSAFFTNGAIGLCLVAAMSYAYGLTYLAPITARAVYLAIIMLVAGIVAVCFSVENPWRMFVYNVISPNVASNVWWLTTLGGIMGGCMFLEFSRMLSSTERSKFRIGILGAVAAIGANNNLGALFTSALDPPIWFGAQLLISFLVSAVLAGCAIVVLAVFVSQRIKESTPSRELEQAVYTCATVMTFMLGLLLVITVIRFVSVFYRAEPGIVAALNLVNGKLALNFWLFDIAVGLVVPLVLLLLSRQKSIRATAIAGACALIGLFSQRYDLLIASQMVPVYGSWQGSESVNVQYFPSISEAFIVIGIFGIIGAGFALGEKFLFRSMQKKITTV